MRLLQRLRNLFLPEGEVSDGFHTFDELYHYRMLYNAAFFNSLEGKYDVHKSYRHADGELCFGGGWFIVMANLPTGQVSNHYRAFSIGLLLVTTDRLIEVNKYNNERRRISQEA